MRPSHVKAMVFLAAVVTLSAACGMEKGACEYTGTNQCSDYMKRDCKSGSFTEGKTCSDLGYTCPNGGGVCKK